MRRKLLSISAILLLILVLCSAFTIAVNGNPEGENGQINTNIDEDYVQTANLLGSDEHTVAGDLKNLVIGVKALITGSHDTDQFVNGLVGAIPLVGLVLIVYGLAYFAALTTIFKDAKHAKFAKIVGIGVALIGVAQQTVYDVVLGFGTTFMTLLFIIGIVMMFVMAINTLRTSSNEIGTNLYKAQKDNLMAGKEVTKLRRDIEKDRRLFDKTGKELGVLDSELETIQHLAGTELQQIDQLAELLGRVSAASPNASQSEKEGFAHSLARQVGSLITTMGHEAKDHHHIHSLLRKIHTHIAYLKKDGKIEKSEEKALKAILGRHLKHHHNGKLHGKEENLLKANAQINHYLKIMFQEIHKLEALEHDVNKYKETLGKFSYDNKHDTAATVRDNIMTYNFKDAHKNLDSLRHMVEQEGQVLEHIRKYERQMAVYVSRIEQQETFILKMDKEMKDSLADISKNDKKKVTEEKDLRKKVNEIPEKLKKIFDEFRKEVNDAGYTCKGIWDLAEDFINDRIVYVKDARDVDRAITQVNDLVLKIESNMSNLEGSVKLKDGEDDNEGDVRKASIKFARNHQLIEQSLNKIKKDLKKARGES